MHENSENGTKFKFIFAKYIPTSPLDRTSFFGFSSKPRCCMTLEDFKKTGKLSRAETALQGFMPQAAGTFAGTESANIALHSARTLARQIHDLARTRRSLLQVCVAQRNMQFLLCYPSELRTLVSCNVNCCQAPTYPWRGHCSVADVTRDVFRGI